MMFIFCCSDIMRPVARKKIQGMKWRKCLNFHLNPGSKWILVNSHSSGISVVLTENDMGNMNRAVACHPIILVILYMYTGTVGTVVTNAA